MKVRALAILLTLLTTAMSAPAETKPASKTEFATIGGGCFWCMEAVFQHVSGVIHSVSGYSGGKTENPTYEDICGHGTGHAEVVQLEFDPTVISYEKLLEIFFAAHDPTTLNRQGADEGDQYRSVIFYHDEEQHKAAGRAKLAAQAHHEDPIVTEIVPLKKFWRAEDYHQDYFNQHPNQGYCAFVIKPKVSKLQHQGVIKE
jgi:peptide-methionine (S)-S-oxide reductase